MFKLDNFGVTLFVSFSYKRLLQCAFYKNFKKSMQKSIFSQKFFKKFEYCNENMYTNSNFKLNYLKNYNDSEDAVKTKNAPFS